MRAYKIIDEFYPPIEGLQFEVITDRDIYFEAGDIAEIDGQVFTLCPLIAHSYVRNFIGLHPRIPGKSFIGKTMYIYNPDEKENGEEE